MYYNCLLRFVQKKKLRVDLIVYWFSSLSFNSINNCMEGLHVAKWQSDRVSDANVFKKRKKL